ncbi:hypothetical protein GCM10011611_24840 [Aliidongia dinghuensis]|uniref:Uncharacterized protein n=1 Tax=Aliidongia dinghuensis TaxID=1867774 RepID=A0A8J2YTF5_9PROT|nr:hypothetical protein [Aliidongia dinghuensis]GGF18027.1 hypothetical protein GCM10011611_24840 [Aliidongia dinghuensis]
MSVPPSQIILVNGEGQIVKADQLRDLLAGDEWRFIVNDEIGSILYIGDLNIYSAEPLESGKYQLNKVLELQIKRFGKKTIRKQIGAKVFSVTEDAIFVVREGSGLRKVYAKNLIPGSILATGEKVFR